MTVAGIPASALLDGTAGLRSSSVRFDVLDTDRNVLGQLMVNRSKRPIITNDTGAPIRRTLSGLEVIPRPLLDVEPLNLYAEDLDTLTMWVKPSWVFAPGGTGYEYPLGVFVFADDSEQVTTAGNPRTCPMVDLSSVLDQDLDATVSYAAGTNIATALGDQADLAGIGATFRSIEVTTYALSQPGAWIPGRDKRSTVMEALCLAAGFLPPYFDNNGLLVCRSAPNLTTTVAAYNFGTATTRGLPVLPGTIYRSGQPLDAPNRYVVVDSGAVTSAVVGTFDVPSGAPNSFANIGRRKVRTIRLQGLASVAAAQAAASAAYATDEAVFTTLSFSTPPDPRHDSFDVVAFDGVNYLQRRWVLPLAEASAMQHDAASTYAG